jgi:hypothetical protein
MADIQIQEVAEIRPSAPKLAVGHSQEQQDVIDYAWQVSNGDMRFLYLLTTENGEYSYQRKHNKLAGSVGTDYGLCGINGYYHSDDIADPRFFTDWRWQTELCYNHYVSGTTFYGIRRFDREPVYRQAIINKFEK